MSLESNKNGRQKKRRTSRCAICHIVTIPILVFPLPARRLLRVRRARFVPNFLEMLGRFRAGRARQDCNAPSSSDSNTAILSQTFTFRAFSDPTPPPSPPPPVGSFEYDVASSKYQMHWETFKDFEDWRAKEQQKHAIELRLVNTYNNTPAYERCLHYVCSRGGTGGRKDYVKQHPDWNRKCENKFTDCKCSLIVKQYPGIPTVLGNYVDTHNHELGNANLRFTQIPKEIREYIAGLLRLKVSPDHIVCRIFLWLSYSRLVLSCTGLVLSCSFSTKVSTTLISSFKMSFKGISSRIEPNLSSYGIYVAFKRR